MLGFSPFEVLIISFLFISAGNTLITYFCCKNALNILKKNESVVKAINKLRIYDEFVLSKINILISLLYFGISYLFISSIVDNGLTIFLSLILSFFITLISVYFSRLSYSYAFNILLDTKLNEWDCFKENFKNLIVTYVPFFIFTAFLPSLFLMNISMGEKIIYTSIFLSFFIVMWVLSTPQILIITLGAKKINNPFLKEKLENLLKEHEIKKFHLYYWDSTKSKDNNAMVSGYYIYYVLVSTSLFEDLTIDELRSILTHEIGHIKNNHLLKLFLIKFSMILILSLLFILPYYIAFTSLQLNLYYIIGIILFTLLFVYDLSIERVYENEADAYARKHSDDIVFESALRKISSFEFEEKEEKLIESFFNAHGSLKDRIERK